MILSASAALVFAIIAGLIVRSGRVTTLAASGIWLSGFTLAGTGLAGPVNHLLTAGAHFLATIH